MTMRWLIYMAMAYAVAIYGAVVFLNFYMHLN